MTVFLVAECENPTCIHEHMLKVYHEVTVDASTVWQWPRRIKESQTEGAEVHKNYRVVALALQ
jgi:hypothetical protein